MISTGMLQNIWIYLKVKFVYFEAIWSFEVSFHVTLGFTKRLLENFGPRVDMKGGCLNVNSPIAAAAAPGKGQIYCKIWQKLQFLADAKERKIYFPPIQKFVKQL